MGPVYFFIDLGYIKQDMTWYKYPGDEFFKMVVFDVCTGIPFGESRCTGTARWNYIMMVASVIVSMSQVVAITDSCCTYVWAVLIYGYCQANSNNNDTVLRLVPVLNANNISYCILVDPAYNCLHDGKCNPNSKICDCSKFNVMNLTNHSNSTATVLCRYSKKQTATGFNCAWWL